MKHVKIALSVMVVALAVLGSSAFASSQGSTAPPSPTDISTSLNVLELSMDQNAGTNLEAFGRSLQQYWSLLQQNNDYPRAYHYFGWLADRYPNNAEVLGQKGSAIGGLFLWLRATGRQNLFTGEQLAALDHSARAAFKTALELDPNSFSALLGYAIYEGFTPGHEANSQALWQKLESLRSTHPEYPWQMVQQLKSKFTARDNRL